MPVQFGFIFGTLFSLSGARSLCGEPHLCRLRLPRRGLNAAFALFAEGLASGIALRCAGQPEPRGRLSAGMKLVVSWVPRASGSGLAQLVGMFTLGAALPHGIRLLGGDFGWQATILVSSLLALLAAAMIHLLGDGPHLKRRHDAPPAAARLGADGLLDSRVQGLGLRLFRASVGLYVLDPGADPRSAGRSRRIARQCRRTLLRDRGDRRARLFAGGTLSHRIGSARWLRWRWRYRRCAACSIHAIVVGGAPRWCLQCCCWVFRWWLPFAHFFRALGARLSARNRGQRWPSRMPSASPSPWCRLPGERGWWRLGCLDRLAVAARTAARTGRAVTAVAKAGARMSPGQELCGHQRHPMRAGRLSARFRARQA